MKIRFTLTGTSPLLMHNERLADPLDPFTRALKAVTGKTKKTDEDHEQMARIEFEGGLYFDSAVGPYWPGPNFHRSLVEGARLTKNGKDVERALLILDDICPVAYKGPRSVEGLYADKGYMLRKSVKTGMSRRVMRTRPMFSEWTLEYEAELDALLLNFEDVVVIAETAGLLVGMGDWRPSSPHGGMYGRYTVVVERL